MKKLSKSIVLILVALALCVTATACNDDPTTTTPAVTKYTVTYDLNGGTGTLPTESDKAEGEKFALAASDGLTKTDKVFDGWSDGTTKYAAGAEYTMPAKAVTLTAQWVDLEPNALTYVLGDNVTTGDDEIKLEDVAPQGGEYLPGAKVTLGLAAAFGVEGKTFGGWSDGETTYPMGYEYTMPAKAVTMTALWIDPLTANDVKGAWTNADGNSLELTPNADYDVDCVGVMDGKSVACYLDMGILMNADYTEMWFITGSPSRLLLSLFNDAEDGEDFSSVVATLIFTQKSEMTNAAISEFAGKWRRSDTNMPLLVTNDGAYYGLYLNEGESYTVGSTLVINAGEAGYYLLKKDGDALKGTYTAFEREPVEVTLAQSDFVTLTVEGEYNQAVIKGATPDEEKIEAAKPSAPSGQEFDKWVIAGTETEFDPTATISADTAIEATFKTPDTSGEKTYVGELSIGQAFLAKQCTKIVFDSSALTVKYTIAGKESTTTATATGNSNEYSCELSTFDFVLKVVDNTLEIYNDDGELVATFTLEA